MKGRGELWVWTSRITSSNSVVSWTSRREVVFMCSTNNNINHGHRKEIRECDPLRLRLHVRLHSLPDYGKYWSKLYLTYLFTFPFFCHFDISWVNIDPFGEYCHNFQISWVILLIFKTNKYIFILNIFEDIIPYLFNYINYNIYLLIYV